MARVLLLAGSMYQLRFDDIAWRLGIEMNFTVCGPRRWLRIPYSRFRSGI